MNYFAHGRRFIEDPYFLAGTAVPDWLNVVDRRVRARSKHAAPLADDVDSELAAVARGIVQHCADDAWFHETRAFAELSLGITADLRRTLPPDDGMRLHFLGHILVELLLDSALIAAEPELLKTYYQALETIDGPLVQAAVTRISGREPQRLAEFIGLFCRERFLWDYAEDGKLLFRVNQVLRRVQLPPLPSAACEVLARARGQVAERQAELLAASIPST